ncbi:MAG: alpha/beta fold hydrolase [Candidatus Aminicenantes bacterium]|nr:alpha/beta fold hydrolase [Candidatus Aminicenantes bacterium]
MRRFFALILGLAVALMFKCVDNADQKKNQISISPKTGFIEVGKARLYYEEMGEGLPLMMIHGGLLNHRMWDDQFEIFAEGYRVIRYDVRNHGQSSGIPGDFKHYEDLHELLEQLNIEKAVILGLSLGGRIAIDFAIAYPERVSAIILAAPGVSGFEFKSEIFKENSTRTNEAFRGGDVERAVEYFQRSWTDGPYRTPSQVDSAVREKVKTMALDTVNKWNPESVAKELDPPAVHRLNEVQAPTLAVVGELDMPGILEIVQLIKENVTGAETFTIADVAHMINMEKPEDFNKIVLDFLKKLELKIQVQ